MAERFVEIAVPKKVRDEIRALKQEMSYSEYFTKELKLKKESAQTTEPGDSNE